MLVAFAEGVAIDDKRTVYSRQLVQRIPEVAVSLNLFQLPPRRPFRDKERVAILGKPGSDLFS